VKSAKSSFASAANGRRFSFDIIMRGIEMKVFHLCDVTPELSLSERSKLIIIACEKVFGPQDIEDIEF
jgi:hypothetical protein